MRLLVVWGLFCALYMNCVLSLGRALLHCWYVGCDRIVGLVVLQYWPMILIGCPTHSLLHPCTVAYIELQHA
jgi:hypothetical protein